MNQYYFVEAHIPKDAAAEVEHFAYKLCSCQGVEEFSMDEQEVDELLAERSYSGGDVPTSVIDEVDLVKLNEQLKEKFFFSEQEKAEKFIDFLKTQFHLDALLVSSDVKDWNEQWKKFYRPIDIDAKFMIIPEWERDLQKDKNKSLLIHPGQGFGTGSHETTFLCLKQFFKYSDNAEISSCLDFGCGSGILGLSAKKKYVDLIVDLYDIDQAALDNTSQNIELNELERESLNLYSPKHRTKIVTKTYNLVFANILQNVLLSEKDYLANSVRQDGLLILSGLLKGQEGEVIQAYQTVNPFLELLEISRKGDWVALIMEHH